MSEKLPDTPPITGLHATLVWQPKWHHEEGGIRVICYCRSDGMGWVIPSGDRWWVTWAHPMLCGRPGWHHHAFGTYVSAVAGAMAFDQVYDLERIAGNYDRCPELKHVSNAEPSLTTALAASRAREAKLREALEACSTWISDAYNLLCPLKSEWQEADAWTDYDEEVFNRRADVNIAARTALSASEDAK